MFGMADLGKYVRMREVLCVLCCPEGFQQRARLLDVRKYGVGQLEVLRGVARGAVGVVGGADRVALSEVLRASDY